MLSTGPLLFLLCCTFAVLISPTPVVHDRNVQALACGSHLDARIDRRALYQRDPQRVASSQIPTPTEVSAATGNTVISLTVANDISGNIIRVGIGSPPKYCELYSFSMTLTVDSGIVNQALLS